MGYPPGRAPVTPHDSENGNASHYPLVVDAAEERRLYEAAMAGRDEPIDGSERPCPIHGDPLIRFGPEASCLSCAEDEVDEGEDA